MKIVRIIPVLFLFLLSTNKTQAQQRIDPKQMNYIINPKPNTIIYNDTLYRGSNQFKYLFYRTGNLQLINLYKKHQQNKIIGNILGIIGAFSTVAGVSITSSPNTKTAGWILIGSGFTSTIVGGYLIASGQKNLLQAVYLFNQEHNKTAIGLGIAGDRAGLVVNF